MSEQFPIIEGFEILELLGQGGMSRVYKANQLGLNRIVALKVLSSISSDVDVKRFQLEAKLTSAMEHPNIIRTLGFGISESGGSYLVLEYLEGRSLRSVLQEDGALSYRRFRDVFLPVLSALGYAHHEGVIHRDIKPANIMLCSGNDVAGQVKLLDFGIAKGVNTQQALTSTGAIIGTPYYISPEQCSSGTVDARSDLYAVSCLMYEAMFGEPPFSGDSALEILHKHLNQAPPAVAELVAKKGVSKELAETLVWGLRKNPEERPQSAGALASRLNKALDTVTLDRMPSVSGNGGNTASRRALPISLAVIAAVSIVLCILMYVQDQKVTASRKSSPKLMSVDTGALIDNARKKIDERHYGEALRELDDVLKRDGVDVKLSAPQKGQICHTAARAAMRKALGLADKGLESDAAKTASYAVKNYANALELLKHMTPQLNMVILDEMAESQLICRDYDGVTKTVSDALELARKYKVNAVVMYYTNGKSLMEQKKYQEAIDSFARSLSISDDAKKSNERRRAVSAISSTKGLYECAQKLGKENDAAIVEQVNRTEHDLLELQFRNHKLDRAVMPFIDLLKENFGQKRAEVLRKKYSTLPVVEI